MALLRGADELISNNEKEFITTALRSEQRLDGRSPFDYRPVQFQFALDGSACTVLLGSTRVTAVVTASLEAPYADRHSEGSLRFNVEFSPMASPAFEPGRPGEEAIELARLVERGIRESRAVDLEALCVQAGRRVWALRVDVHVLDHDGNITDAAGLAALGALCAFRRPDAVITGDGTIVICPPEEKEPLPLTLHHLPLPISFALFEGGDVLAIDPGLKEEAAAAGTFTATVNPHGELCAVQKVRGVGLSPAQTMRCIRVAATKVKDLVVALRTALDAHEKARVGARVRRHGGSMPAGQSGADGRSVLVLRSEELALGQNMVLGNAGEELPEDVARALQHAAAADSSELEEEEAEDTGGSGSSSELSMGSDQLQAGDQDKAAAGVAAVEEEGAALPAVASKQAAPVGIDEEGKEAKRRKMRGEGGGDQFAAIADMIASAGGRGAAAGDDLSAAVKRK